MEGGGQLNALEKIKLLSLPGIGPQFLDSPVHNLITILTEPSWSVYSKSCIQFQTNFHLTNILQPN